MINKKDFIEKILNKQNVLFLIEIDDGYKIGGFISNEIDKVSIFDVNRRIWVDSIVDKNAFIFTFKNDEPKKFKMKENGNNWSFFLYSQNDSAQLLFAIGGGDLIVNENYTGHVYQDQYSSFDYEGNDNALIGNLGNVHLSNIKIKRILIIQMI